MNANAWPLEFNPTDTMVVVFRLPDSVPNGYCFHGGYAVQFQMVDWFDAGPDPSGRTYSDDELKQYVRQKNYCKFGGNFLVLKRNGSALLVLKEKKESHHAP